MNAETHFWVLAAWEEAKKQLSDKAALHDAYFELMRLADASCGDRDTWEWGSGMSKMGAGWIVGLAASG